MLKCRIGHGCFSRLDMPCETAQEIVVRIYACPQVIPLVAGCEQPSVFYTAVACNRK